MTKRAIFKEQHEKIQENLRAITHLIEELERMRGQTGTLAALKEHIEGFKADLTELTALVDRVNSNDDIFIKPAGQTLKLPNFGNMLREVHLIGGIAMGMRGADSVSAEERNAYGAIAGNALTDSGAGSPNRDSLEACLATMEHIMREAINEHDAASRPARQR